jgi:hypothetical protein
MRFTVSKKLVWAIAILYPIGLAGGLVYWFSKKSPAQAPAAGAPAPPPADDLQQASKVGKTDKGFPGHWYTENYERFLRPWKNEPVRIFEIGIADGGSLAMWQAYFPRASVYGVDINEAKRFENDRVKTCIADQSKRDQLKKCLDKFGGQFDLLIDDGGHSMEQQQVSFGFLFPYVKPGGFYSIEDLHTSMPNIYADFGVEPNEVNSTLTMIFKFIHSAPPKVESKYMLPGELAYLDAEVESTDLHLANNQGHSLMCIFKKRAHLPPSAAPSQAPAGPIPAIQPDNTATKTRAQTAPAGKIQL